MAVLVLQNALVTVNAVDLSDHVTSVTLDTGADDIDTTAMSSSGYKSRVGGLKEWSVQVNFQQDFAASKVDATIFPLLGTVTAVTIKAVNAATSTTNPLYSGNVLVTEYQPVANGVGELATTSVTWPGTAALTRATS